MGPQLKHIELNFDKKPLNYMVYYLYVKGRSSHTFIKKFKVEF